MSKYIVKVNVYNNDRSDYFDHEYDGVRYEHEQDAIEVAADAMREPDIESVWIKEVDNDRS